MSTKRKPAAAPRRPSKRQLEAAARGRQQSEICAWLAEGKSLASYCRKHGTGYSTVMQWLDEDEKFSENYTRARENAADADADIITDIREQVVAGTIAPDVARVAIDAAKWSAGKRKPKKYGDKLETKVEHSGSISLSNVLSEIQAGGLPSHDT